MICFSFDNCKVTIQWKCFKDENDSCINSISFAWHVKINEKKEFKTNCIIISHTWLVIDNSATKQGLILALNKIFWEKKDTSIYLRCNCVVFYENSSWPSILARCNKHRLIFSQIQFLTLKVLSISYLRKTLLIFKKKKEPFICQQKKLTLESLLINHFKKTCNPSGRITPC